MEIYYRKIGKEYLERFISLGKESDPDIEQVARCIWVGYKFYIVASCVEDTGEQVRVSVSPSRAGRTDWSEMRRIFGQSLGACKEEEKGAGCECARKKSSVSRQAGVSGAHSKQEGSVKKGGKKGSICKKKRGM